VARRPAIRGTISAVRVSRRTLLGAGLATTAAALSGCTDHRKAVWAEPAAEPAAAAAPGEAPPAAAPLRAGTTKPTRAARRTAPYGDAVTAALTKFLAPTPENPHHPGYAGAVALVAVDGRTTLHTAVGHAVRYRSGPVELPEARRVAMRPDSVFDLASITKVFTAVLVLHLVDRGKVELGAPVRRYLRDFTGPGKDAVTVSMLLAHTGALPVGARVTKLGGNAGRWKAVLRTPLVEDGVPGTTFRYSSVGLMVLGRLVETVTGTSLEQALRTVITGPLGLADTGFRPLRWADRDRLVATDARTSRGLLRGTVHDDVCARLGGVAGHAGVFGTAADLAVLGQMLLDGGTHRGRRILSTAVVKAALTNVNRGKPAIDTERPGRTADHGLGVEMNQPWFMGRLATPASFGHTGFTGTSLVVVPKHRMVVVLLTNRAHPNWSWSDPDVHRVAVADAIAAHLGG
jgi:CubicO group peptidase (beta-lactamase class C family)